MEYRISDLLDSLQENEIYPENGCGVSAARIRALTRGKIRGKTRGAGRRILSVAMAAALLLALGVTAYAVGVHMGFINNAYGKGIASQEEHEYVLRDGEGNVVKTEHFPAVERVEADPEQAEEVVGGYVSPVGSSMTIGDFTVTVEELVMDENGIGSVSILMENPKGYDFDYEQRPEISLGYSTKGSEGTFISSRDYIVTYSVSETSCRYVYYFAPISPLGENEAVMLNYSLIGEQSILEEKSIALMAEKRLPVRKYETEGVSVELSAVGVLVNIGSGGEENVMECFVDKLYISYNNGEGYAAAGGETVTTALSTKEGGSFFMAFNRLADPDSVSSIELESSVIYMDGQSESFEAILR